MLHDPMNLSPFNIPWNDVTPSVTDLSHLLDPPAGKDGFVHVEEGHLSAGSRRLRLWGVNLTGAACLPPKGSAPAIARHLAKFGINSVRLHYLDGQAPRGIIAGDIPDTQHFDTEMLDRLDYFVAELIRVGIYINLNLNVYRRVTEADGVVDAELLGVAKNATFFDSRLIELQKQYARDLLTHRNPYTEKTYAADPGVCIVEITNENSLLEGWVMGRLRGCQTEPPAGIWSDIPPRYAAELTKQYNTWLQARYPTRATLAAVWNDGSNKIGLADDEDPRRGTVRRIDHQESARYSDVRFRTEAAFYAEVEQHFYDDFAAYLREELGVTALILGTSDHNHRLSGLPLVRIMASLDVVDGHIYWQHPRFPNSGASWSRTEWTITNTPMVNEPDRCTVTQLARSAVHGKPYIVSEVNHPFPNEYAAEGIVTLAAYAALQDWDGVYWYTYGHEALDESSTPYVAGFFDLHTDPVKMAQIAAGALLYLREDVRPANQFVGLRYTPDEVLDSLRIVVDEKENFNWIPGLSPRLPLVHRLRIDSLDAVTARHDYPQIEPTPRIMSDTRELTWDISDRRSGFLTIDTRRTQALIGFLGGRTVDTTNLLAQLETTFCAVVLTSLDDQPIETGSRLLLLMTARVANSGMIWDEQRKGLGAHCGGPPTLIEPAVGRIQLRGLAETSAVRIEALDATGSPRGNAVPIVTNRNVWEITVPTQPATIWYLVSVEHNL